MAYSLKFDIHSFWRAGTGRGGGAEYNETCIRDAYGLPILPGRTVKGLIRDAVYRMEQWKHVDEGTTECWFGTRLDGDEIVEKPVSGILRFSNAELEENIRSFLQETQSNDELLAGFFHAQYATAIENNVALDSSLRVMEVTIPLTLYAQFEVLDDAQFNREAFKKCLSLIRGLGSHRTRGLGRVTVSLPDKQTSNGERTHAA